LLAAFTDPDRALVTVLLVTGCRFFEAIGLQVTDVDLVRREITFRRGVTEASTGTVVAATKNNKRDASTPRSRTASRNAVAIVFEGGG
jgi:integrase